MQAVTEGSMNTLAATLDARGLLCPLPVLKIRKRLKGLAVGQILKIHADDPAARVDIPHFCSEQGHELLGTEDHKDGFVIFTLRKAGRTAPLDPF